MINEYQETVHNATCDGCLRDFEHSFEGWSVFFDKDSLTQRMQDQEWHIGDGEEGAKGFCYCPQCFTRDDNDVFSLTLVSPVFEAYREFPDNKDFPINSHIRFERVEPFWKYKISDCQGERVYTPEFFEKFPWLFRKVQ